MRGEEALGEDESYGKCKESGVRMTHNEWRQR